MCTILVNAKSINCIRLISHDTTMQCGNWGIQMEWKVTEVVTKMQNNPSYKAVVTFCLYFLPRSNVYRWVKPFSISGNMQFVCIVCLRVRKMANSCCVKDFPQYFRVICGKFAINLLTWCLRQEEEEETNHQYNVTLPESRSFEEKKGILWFPCPNINIGINRNGNGEHEKTAIAMHRDGSTLFAIRCKFRTTLY